MKTEKQQVGSTAVISSSSILPSSTTTNSSTLTKNQCLGSRIAPGGAVVCFHFLFFIKQKNSLLRFRKKQIKMHQYQMMILKIEQRL
jgi:hypothetical protein